MDSDLLISPLLVSNMPATLAKVAQGIYRSHDQLLFMSQDVKSNAELSMSAFLRDNPTYENGFNKRGQAHLTAQVLNVACLLFLTQKWASIDSLAFRFAGYVRSVLARCSRCTFRPQSAPTAYIPPVLFSARSASCVSTDLAPLANHHHPSKHLRRKV